METPPTDSQKLVTDLTVKLKDLIDAEAYKTPINSLIAEYSIKLKTAGISQQ